MNYDVGVDIGSVSINCVILDENRRVVLETPYLRHFGLIYEETRKLLENILLRIRGENSGVLRSVSFTGVHGELLAEKLHAPFEVETIAQVVGAIHVVPGVRTIITVGGQDAAVFQLAHSGDQWRLESFNMNGPCASGTGSFIDQQAERLAQSIYGPDFSMDQEKLQQTLGRLYRTGSEEHLPRSGGLPLHGFYKIGHDPPPEQGGESAQHHSRPAFRQRRQLHEHHNRKPGALRSDHFHRRHGLQPTPGPGFQALFPLADSSGPPYFDWRSWRGHPGPEAKMAK